MSSFIGHGLAALTLYALERPARPLRWGWMAWLVVLALAPDIDYVVAALRLPGTPIIRVTHSLAGCLTLPALTIGLLRLRGERGLELTRHGLQAAGAGLSHVVLDLLVGVTPAALLWPLSRETWVLPVGVLPSAGRIRLSNPLFYRNLLIELGVLVPLVTGLVLARHRILRPLPRSLLLAALALLSACFMAWAASLPR
jgi:inner membrane protein